MPRRFDAAGQCGDLTGVDDIRAVRGAEPSQRRQIEAAGAAVVEQVEPARRISENARGAVDLSEPELAPGAVPPVARLVRERDPVTLGLHPAQSLSHLSISLI